MFTREELIDIETRAIKQSKVGYIDPQWKRAYEELAYAANVLDAFMGRSEIQTGKSLGYKDTVIGTFGD